MATKILAAAAVLGLSACAYTPVDEVQTEAEPPVKQNVTPYDDALMCLGAHMEGGKSAPLITVGRVNDLTGKQAISDGGSGAYITQGGPDIVMGAVMTTGSFRLVNTQDVPLSNIIAQRLGADARLAPSYYVAGSVNTLDFVPGGGVEVGVAGVGAGYRQYSLLVGIDLFLVDGKTDAVIASTKMLKRVTAQEIKAGLTRFFGTTLVDISAGVQQREALHVALRGMLKYATYDLLSNFVAKEKLAATCDEYIRQADEVVTDEPTANAVPDGLPVGLAHLHAETRS